MNNNNNNSNIVGVRGFIGATHHVLNNVLCCRLKWVSVIMPVLIIAMLRSQKREFKQTSAAVFHFITI